MRIDLNSSVPQRVATEKSTKSTDAASVARSAQDQDGDGYAQDTVRLSGLAAQAMAMPEVRQDLVSRLRQSVQSGQYSVDPQKIAEAMLHGAGK